MKSSALTAIKSRQAEAVSETAPLLQPVTFLQPVRIEYGTGSARSLGTFIEGWTSRRVLVVADPFNAARADLLGLPADHLVFGDVKPEPDLPNLDALLGAARAFSPDVIVGFGGGSAMDLAKLASVMVQSEKTLSQIAGPHRADPRHARLVAIPTTAGTGSEVGSRALVTDPATQSKIAVESRHMVADLAIVDPELTVSLPPAITAATGVDALAHCVEAFTSRRAHPLVDIYALKGITLIGEYLARAVADGSDVEARAALAMAALYGGLCLGPVNTTAGHALSYPLGTRFGVPHGLANAVIFPHTLAFNAASRPAKSAQVASALGLEGESLLDSAHGYCESLGIEMQMSALGVRESDIDLMADEAFAIRRLLDFNPCPISRDEIAAIYRAAL